MPTVNVPTRPRFFDFDQNNSGGHFEDDHYLSHNVVIEAFSVAEANAKAVMLGIHFDGVDKGWDCACCGDRWYEAYEDSGMLIEDLSISAGGDFDSLETIRVYRLGSNEPEPTEKLYIFRELEVESPFKYARLKETVE